MKRYGSVLAVHERDIPRYRELHASVWPGVASMIRACNIRNYSIFLRRLPDGEYYLFSYYEYVGNDYQADMARMAADPTTQRWWEECMPCQEPLPDRDEGEWWAAMEEVFHQE